MPVIVHMDIWKKLETEADHSQVAEVFGDIFNLCCETCRTVSLPQNPDTVAARLSSNLGWPKFSQHNVGSGKMGGLVLQPKAGPMQHKCLQSLQYQLGKAIVNSTASAWMQCSCSIDSTRMLVSHCSSSQAALAHITDADKVNKEPTFSSGHLARPGMHSKGFRQMPPAWRS